METTKIVILYFIAMRNYKISELFNTAIFSLVELFIVKDQCYCTAELPNTSTL